MRPFITTIAIYVAFSGDAGEHCSPLQELYEMWSSLLVRIWNVHVLHITVLVKFAVVKDIKDMFCDVWWIHRITKLWLNSAKRES